MSALPVAPSGAKTPDTLRLRSASIRLSCDVACSIDELRHMRAEWDRLVDRLNAGACMTYDWCRTWWEHYGLRREMRIFIFRDEKELAGVIPMYIDRRRLGPATLRVARLIGSDFTQVLVDPPVRNSCAQATFDEILQRLFIDDRCDAISFSPISERSPRLKALRRAIRSRPDLANILHDRVLTQQAAIDLPDSFDAYVQSLSKNQRSNLRKAERRLSDDHEVTVQMITEPEETAAEFDEFLLMHACQWRRRGKLGHFGDWPRAEQFHRSLVMSLSGAGRVRMLRLCADGQAVGRVYGFVVGDTCHCQFSARLEDEQWARHGLGRLCLAKLIEHLIDEGVRTVDAGVGRYDYKLRLRAKEHNVRSILLIANRLGVKSRAKLFRTLADAIDRIYYKLWYCRVAPRIPLPHRPLWKAWITSQL